MLTHPRSYGLRIILAAALLAFGLLTITPGLAVGHGGKTHADEPFSALQAVQKALTLIERLILSGKLPESWETDLSSIQVTIRGVEDSREYVVQFKRASGDPQNVYVYFDRQGTYAGSNFTGD